MRTENRLKIVLDSEIGFKDIDKAMVGLTSLFKLASVHKNVVYVDLKDRDDASFLIDNIHSGLRELGYDETIQSVQAVA